MDSELIDQKSRRLIRSHTTRNVAAIGFGLTLAVLVVGAGLGYTNVRRLEENGRGVAHTHEAIGALEILLSTLKDAETGQRGYLLADDEKYLGPYDDALTRVQAELAHLQGLMSDNADQEAHLAVLEKKIDVRLDELKRTVALMKKGDRSAALKIVRSGNGQAHMDDLRQEIAVMQQTEHDLLRQRAHDSAASYRTTVLSILLTAIIGVVLVGVVFYLSQRNLRRRQRAAEVLAEQKERLRTTLASIGDAVITTDTEGRVTNLNPVAESLTGWPNDQATGQPLDAVFRIVNETTRQPVGNPAFKALQEGVIVGLANHTVLIAKDATERPIDDSAAPIRCKDGEVVGCVLVFRDITVRKREEVAQAERTRLIALRAEISTALASAQDTATTLQCCSEALVRHLDVAFARIWTLDDTGNMLELQASAGLYTHLNGLHSRIPVGQYKIGRIASNRQPHLTNAVLDDPNVSDREWAAREGMVAFAGYPLAIEGRVVGVVAMFARRPLTEGVLTELAPLAEGIAQFMDRRRAEAEQRALEEELRESAQQLRFVMDSMPQKIFTAKPDGDVDYFNPIWMQFTGLSFEAIRDWGWTQFIHPDDVAENIRVWRHSIDTGAPFQFEHRFRRRDGAYRWHISRALPMRGDAGRIIMWVGSNTDIHEQKETTEDLRKLTAELSEADRRKDEFLATLAHELRNPLAPIRNGLQIMRLAGTSGATVEQARTMMERQLGQMVHLVDDLLDVSRISRGKLELRKQEVELAVVLNSAVETSRPLIDASGHKLTVSMPATPVLVDADVTRLTQVFANLLNNAAKYSERGGHIRLTAECQGSAVVVSVKDSGVGIPPDMLPKIFEMFTQVDRSLEKSQGGLGIGLTLVKRLVTMHGGSVEAHSAGSGTGSEFSVRLPVTLPGVHEVKPPAEEGEPACRVHCRILVADDNEDSATSLAMMLKIMGNEVRTAGDGLQAVDVAAAFRPDVILLDIGMPKLNGYEACRRIHAQPWSKQTFLIAVTGWGQEEDRRRSEEAGFNHHMVKPIDPVALEKLLAGLSDAVRK